MRLARPVIGILAEDDDPDLVERRQIERREPLAAFGEDALAGLPFGDEEVLQRLHIGLSNSARSGASQLSCSLTPSDTRPLPPNVAPPRPGG